MPDLSMESTSLSCHQQILMDMNTPETTVDSGERQGMDHIVKNPGSRDVAMGQILTGTGISTGEVTHVSR